MATILVVDDEMGIRELLSEILSDEGHVVELAEDAQQARDFRLRQVPDLVLLDIWMPDTDGVTLLKEWAAQSLLTMPVIMMSGHATIDTAVEATKIGALNFLEKPIALQKLLKQLKALDDTAPRNNTETSGPNPAVSQYQLQRADILERIVGTVKPEEREPWIRQVADSLSTAAQSDPSNNVSMTRLLNLEQQHSAFALSP